MQHLSPQSLGFVWVLVSDAEVLLGPSGSCFALCTHQPPLGTACDGTEKRSPEGQRAAGAAGSLPAERQL